MTTHETTFTSQPAMGTSLPLTIASASPRGSRLPCRSTRVSSLVVAALRRPRIPQTSTRKIAVAARAARKP
jgi:hypothetical protein